MYTKSNKEIYRFKVYLEEEVEKDVDVEKEVEVEKEVDVEKNGSFSFNIDLFKSGAGKLESERLGVPLLGQIPISQDIVKTTPNIYQAGKTYIDVEYLLLMKLLFHKLHQNHHQS